MSLKDKHKSHVDHPDFDCGQDGSGNSTLSEPVPNPVIRPGDKRITGAVDNNAQILIGRDCSNVKNSDTVSSNDPLQENSETDYSGNMGAGCVDIVCGRGSPYPVNLPVGTPSLPMLPCTRTDPVLAAVKLKDGSSHPTILMDAARIYISQMCSVDEYFKFTKTDTFQTDRGPSSTIVLKADRCRIHARRDIKIIAGGAAGPKIDSNGYKIKEKGRIHLIAGNGNYGSQQPIPLGRNLVSCLKDINKSIQDVLEIVNNLAFSQSALDAVVSNSIRVSGAGPSASDPISQVQNIIKQISDMKDKISIYGAKFVNLPSLEIDYLEPNGGKYILSRYNTTN